jgi:competence protein ComEC
VRPALEVGGWRLAVVAGIAAGLALSPFLAVYAGPWRAAAGLVCLLVLLAYRSRLGPAGASLVLCGGLLFGLTAGGARLAAIDGDALRLRAGTVLSLEGFAETAPRFSRGVARFVLDSDHGRVMVEAPGVSRSLPVGAGVVARGEVRPPPDWYRPILDRQGISMMLYTDSVEPTGESRGGLTGYIDRLRVKAEDSLARSMPAREAALARGFVLGQDQEIDPITVTDFQNSGLAHLLAVSGQNVVLLSLLGIAVMAVAGVDYRRRLIVLAVLILLYVPLAGGGPSIQRAGVMGLAGLAALAASRPASRVFILALATAVTLLINPRAGADVGWQLSFVAVVGIALLARPIASRLAGLLPDANASADGKAPGKPAGGSAIPRAALIDGAAVTVAASLVTAPLMAFHFERIPVATILANLAALPAVAPAMWLGMSSAAVGQIWTGFSVPLNLLNSVFLAYIAQIAAWFGRPGWAVAQVGIPSAWELLAIYALLATIIAAGLWFSRKTPLEPGEMVARTDLRRRQQGATLVAVALLAALFVLLPGDGRRHLAAPPEGGARIEILDIGQGDATLIRPHGSDPVLVDGGPPGGGIESALASADVERLEAVVATHADLDHVGGLYEVFESREVGRYLFDGTPKALLDLARQRGADPQMLAEGDKFRIGPLLIDVLWPRPRPADFVPPDDRNDRSIVLLLSWKGSRVLLTGDGEAEAVPVDPGPLDVLRVAHHGSDDAGLPVLLDNSRPPLAVLSVGEGNLYGHPTGDTLDALAEAGSAVLRTDLNGTVSIVLSEDGLTVETGR